jgi:hypothetical protein
MVGALRCVDNTFANDPVAEDESINVLTNFNNFAYPFVARRDWIRNRYNIIAR